MTPLHPAEQDALAAAQARDLALRNEPERRRAHGVVHTPPALARFVIAAADELVRQRFGCSQGLASARVQLVDPACGPGAFLAAASRLWQARGRPADARLVGIDLDPAALASAAALSAHAPVRFTLVQADSLREPVLCELAERQGPDELLVIAGNPPWASVRAESTGAMQQLLEDFRRDPAGERLAERKLGVLADSYVRFFRVCAEAARRSRGGAIVALVTNGSFLDGPVHRGMRGALARWFDEIHVIDLGGSALLSRPEPGAGRDENVFGVRPSVTVTLLTRLPAAPLTLGEPPARAATLRYARLRGSRADKLVQLEAAALCDLAWTELAPAAPTFGFVPARSGGGQYAAWTSLAEAMPFHREGVQTNRDRVVVDRDRGRLLERLRAFARGESLPELAAANRASFHYDVQRARAALAAALERDPDGAAGFVVRPIAYRPFDSRWFCAVAPLCHRPRPELLRAIEHSPHVLVSVRKDRGFSAYSLFAASDRVIDNCLLSTRSSCRARAFPASTPEGADNLASPVRDACEQVAGEAVSARDYQCYALSFLASLRYRTRFDAELRADYPRLPPPRAHEHWHRLVEAGRALAALFSEPLNGADDGGDHESDRSLRDFRVGHHLPYAELAGDATLPHARQRLAWLGRRLERLDRALAAADRRLGDYGYL